MFGSPLAARVLVGGRVGGHVWHSACGLSNTARKDLHVLRIWRNASDHHDSERWRRDGPSSAEEASAVLDRIAAAIGALEGQ